MRRTLAVLLAMTVLACASDDDGDDAAADESSSGDAAAFDEDAVVARAMGYATELVRIDAQSRPSQHGLAATVSFYVAPEIAAMYRTLDPSQPGPAVDFPDGSLLVKQHLDETGTAVGYTIMAKGDPASTSDGWWWGRVDATGALKDHGQVGYCIACHEAVAADGWAFGVPLDNRR